VLLKFAFRMQPGDLVVYPHKPDSTLNFDASPARTSTKRAAASQSPSG
jgi:hypothetical protein